MSSHQPAPSASNSGHSDIVTNAVLTVLAETDASAFVLERAPQSSDPSVRPFIIWLIGVGRFCLTVRTGRHEIREDSWYLDASEGFRRTPSPLMQAWDEAVLARSEIHRHLGTWVMIAPAVAFPDADPDGTVQQVAERGRVVAVSGLEDLVQRWTDSVSADPQISPPTQEHADRQKSVLRNEGAPSTGPPK